MIVQDLQVFKQDSCTENVPFLASFLQNLASNASLHNAYKNLAQNMCLSLQVSCKLHCLQVTCSLARILQLISPFTLSVSRKFC